MPENNWVEEAPVAVFDDEKEMLQDELDNGPEELEDRIGELRATIDKTALEEELRKLREDNSCLYLQLKDRKQDILNLQQQIRQLLREKQALEGKLNAMKKEAPSEPEPESTV